MQPLPQNIQGKEGVRLRGRAICKEGIRGLKEAPLPRAQLQSPVSTHCLPWWPVTDLQGSSNILHHLFSLDGPPDPQGQDMLVCDDKTFLRVKPNPPSIPSTPAACASPVSIQDAPADT